MQLTSAALIHAHIYAETPVSSPHSRRFVYSRYASIDRPVEYWLCDLATRELRPLTSAADGPSVYRPVVTYSGRWMVYASVSGGSDDSEPGGEIRRIVFDDPDARSEVVRAIAQYQRPYPLGTISPDRRYYATLALLAPTTHGPPGFWSPT